MLVGSFCLICKLDYKYIHFVLWLFQKAYFTQPRIHINLSPYVFYVQLLANDGCLILQKSASQGQKLNMIHERPLNVSFNTKVKQFIFSGINGRSRIITRPSGYLTNRVDKIRSVIVNAAIQPNQCESACNCSSRHTMNHGELLIEGLRWFKLTLIWHLL